MHGSKGSAETARVSGPRSAPVPLSLSFKLTEAAPAEARRALAPLRSVLEATTFEEMRLLVTELVTNAVRHAKAKRGMLSLLVRVRKKSIRVEVTDPGGGFEPPAKPTAETSGFGLVLVDRLARRWGVDRSQRNRVWLELSRR